MVQNLIDRDSLIGMVAGPLVWAVHFLVSYILNAVACAFGWTTAEPGGWGIVNWMLVAVSAAALLALGALMLLAYRRWNQVMAQSGDGDPELGRHRFMARTALLLCILSTIAVVYATVPMVILSPCQ